MGRRALAAVRAAPAWLGGILTGAQGLALSYVAILAPTLAVAAAAPVEGVAATEWSGAVSVATHTWLLGHGAAAEVAGVSITLVPLGLTLLNAAILAGVARRFTSRTWGSWGFAVATYTAGVGVVAVSVTATDAAGSTVLPAVLVAAVLSAVAVGIGVRRAHGIGLAWLTTIPDWVRLGVRRASASLAVVVGAAAVAGALWAVAGRQQIAQTATSLELDTVSAGVLAVAETAYVPTLVVWMVAWLSGQGFAVGVGTAYAPDALATDALPHLPLLGALPSGSGGLLLWAPTVIVVVVAAVRVVLARRSLEWRMNLAADGVAAGIAGVVAAIAFVITQGSVGPGRLETVGAEPLAAAVAVLGLIAGGLILGTLIDHAMGWITGDPPKSSGARKPTGASAVKNAREDVSPN